MLKLYQIWNYLIPKVLVIIFRYYFTEFYDNPLKIMAAGRYVTEPSQAKFTANLRKYCDIEKHNKNWRKHKIIVLSFNLSNSVHSFLCDFVLLLKDILAT